MIFVLTYDAPHRKTQDLLFRLKAEGYKEITVLATPWKTRKNFKPILPHRQLEPLNIQPKYFSLNLGYSFYSIKENELKFNKNDLVLIGGAGILPKKVVRRNNVINSHPAYLPYVRGLDSFKWAIYNNKPLGVTTHIVSEECDAGKLIKRLKVPIYSWDTFHSLAYRQYEMEINMLASSIKDFKKSNFEKLSITDSIPSRRMPNSIEVTLIPKLNELISRIDGDRKC